MFLSMWKSFWKMEAFNMTKVMKYLSELIHAQLSQCQPSDVPEGITVEELEHIAHTNHMRYMILGALLKTNITEEEKNRIRPYVTSSVLQTLTQMNCLQEMEKQFNQKGISYQILKGSVLKYIYPSPEMREMSDIDVLIFDKSMEKAKSVMQELGLVLKKSIKHHDVYMKPPFLAVELHWALYDRNVDKNLFEYFKNTNNLRKKKGSSYALEFSPEDFYVYMIAHMAKHFYETGCGIRNIVDVYIYRIFWREQWDTQRIQSQLEQCGLSVFEDKIHTLSSSWLEGKMIDSFSESLFEYMLECGIYGKAENGIWGQFVKQKGEIEESNKEYLKKWYYFPPFSYMVERYPFLRNCPYLLPAAWSIRAMHGVFNKRGNEKRNLLLHLENEEIMKMNKIYKGVQLEFKNE